MTGKAAEQVRKVLESHYLFSSFEPEQREQLAAAVRLVKLRPDQLLFQHGDRADRFFLVLAGQVKLFRTTPDGNEKVMELMTPGRSFGEAVMFMEQQRYPVSAQALKASVLLAVPGSVYLQLLRDRPEVCFALLADLSKRLHNRLNEVENLSLQNAGHRVALFLLKRLPSDAEDGAEIQLEAPKQIIASHLGMKPETFSRALASLTQQGIISVKGRRVRVLKVDALAAG